MRSHSLQQSLLEEILALEQILQPSNQTSTYDNKSKLNNFLRSAHYQPKIRTQKNLNNFSQYQPKSYIQHNNKNIETIHLGIESKITEIKPKINSSLDVRKDLESYKRIKTEHEDPRKILDVGNSVTARKSANGSFYEKCSKYQNLKKSIISYRKQQQMEKQWTQCTHRPTINQTSQAIMEKLNRQQFIQKMKEKRNEAKQKWIKDAENKQMKECSFTPNISKQLKPKTDHKQANSGSDMMRASVALSQQESINTVNVSVFDALYEQSKSRAIKNRQKQEQYVAECVRKPKIDPISKKITAQSNFNQRMMYYEHKKMEKQRENYIKTEKQNRQMHKPKINPSSKRRLSQVPVGQRLYQQSKKLKNFQQSIRKKSVVTKKSNKVYQERKVLVFYQLFKILDSDQDGIISINNMKLDSLPRQIVHIIYPLVEQLDNLEVQLHEHEFISSLYNLFKTLTIHQKDLLLGFGGKRQEQPEPNFQPKINSKSLKIAREIQRSDYSIYDYCSIKMIEKQRQLETERIEKDTKQLKHCTFKPKIINRYRY